MNNQRRKQLEAVKERLSSIETLLEDIKTELEQIESDEQEYYDNMPEFLQASERGEKSEEAIQYINESYGNVDEIIQTIQNANEAIDNSIQ